MKGVVVGCDENQEWLLSWWWEHYSAHNSYPVAFFDFGMSEKARSWCRERGQLFELEAMAPLKEVSLPKKEEWKAFLEFRTAWFKKPFALHKSPFDMSCWIDLDCEVRGNIDPLFEALGDGNEIALVKEHDKIQENHRDKKAIANDETIYNSGVVALRKNAKVLISWISVAQLENHQFMSDQCALSRIIYLSKAKVANLSPIYNWLKTQGDNERAVIVHYNLSYKLEILEKIQLSLFHQILHTSEFKSWSPPLFNE